MTTPAANPPPLPVETFYKSVRTYRTWRTFMLIAVGLLAGTPLFLGVIDHLTHRMKGDQPSLVLYLATGCFLLPALILVSKSIRNVREPIEIRSEGIRWKHNFWYWPQIKSIAPQKVNFATKYFLRVGLNVDPRVCRIEPDEALTPRQYVELIGRLKPFLDAQHPAVQLKSLPR